MSMVKIIAQGRLLTPGARQSTGTIRGMDINQPTPLLAGLSPAQFMRRHWQKKPLLIRQAVPGITPPLSRPQMFALAGQDGVESRLITQSTDGSWALRHGPFTRGQLPKVSTPAWTMLVQGLDLHLPEAHELLKRFRFVPDARLDDLMISWASDGGGVGPHFDSYDVFLLQVSGRRRWRIGRLDQPELQPDVPLKILSNFVAEEEWLLEPGDMLYLPPRWAHDGVAEGECMTCSIGFRSAGRDEVGVETIQRLLDAQEAPDVDVLYRDPKQEATTEPGRIPAALQDFAADAVARLMKDPEALNIALGEWLSEPKRGVWFEPGEDLDVSAGVTLDRRTRMMYDATQVYINGDSYRSSGRDARLMQQLADTRALSGAQVAQLSAGALGLLQEWCEVGWVVAVAARG
jgi:50S ribosomal protein L16 3-hydroxylase